MFDGNTLVTLTRPSRNLEGAPWHLAPWHAKRPHLVASALSYVRFAQPALVLLAERILPRVPRRVLASDTLHVGRAESGLALLDDAVEGPWLTWNTHDYTNAITVDVDHGRWDDLIDLATEYYGCPRPLVVFDRVKRTAHLTWFLAAPVRTALDARRKPLAWLQRIRAGLTAMFEADAGYTNRLTKNPFSSQWDTLPGDGSRVELATLWATVTTWCEDHDLSLPKSFFIRPTPSPDESLKGTRLFDVLRHRCYATGETNRATIHAWAFEIAAELRSPAPSKHIESVAKSVAKFMSTKWTGRVRRASRGVMRLTDTALTTVEKQSMAGKRTSVIVARRTESTLEKAFRELTEEGKPFVRKDLASRANVSVKTVQRRWATLVRGGTSAVASGSAPPWGAEEPQATTPSESNSNLEPFFSTTTVSKSKSAVDVSDVDIRASIDPRTDPASKAVVQNLEVAQRPFTQANVLDQAEVFIRTVRGVREAQPISRGNVLIFEPRPPKSLKTRSPGERYRPTLPGRPVTRPRFLGESQTASRPIKPRCLVGDWLHSRPTDVPSTTTHVESVPVQTVGGNGIPPTAGEIQAIIDLMKAVVTKAADEASEPVEPPPVHFRLARIPEVRRVQQEAESACREAKRRWRTRPPSDLVFEDDDDPGREGG